MCIHRVGLEIEEPVLICGRQFPRTVYRLQDHLLNPGGGYGENLSSPRYMLNEEVLVLGIIRCNCKPQITKIDRPDAIDGPGYIRVDWYESIVEARAFLGGVQLFRRHPNFAAEPVIYEARAGFFTVVHVPRFSVYETQEPILVLACHEEDGQGEEKCVFVHPDGHTSGNPEDIYDQGT